MPNHYTTIAICSPGHDFDVTKFNNENAKTDFCNLVKPMPEEVRHTASPLTSEDRKRGAKQDWYDWARENWGTKWGTYDAESFALGGDGSPVLIKFQSAWGPPKTLEEIATWLKQAFGFENIVWIGFDPYDDSVKMLNGSA